MDEKVSSSEIKMATDLTRNNIVSIPTDKSKSVIV